jgi:hypothetical protein
MRLELGSGSWATHSFRRALSSPTAVCRAVEPCNNTMVTHWRLRAICSGVCRLFFIESSASVSLEPSDSDPFSIHSEFIGRCCHSTLRELGKGALETYHPPAPT